MEDETILVLLRPPEADIIPYMNGYQLQYTNYRAKRRL
jgi:hypothetical protein